MRVSINNEIENIYNSDLPAITRCDSLIYLLKHENLNEETFRETVLKVESLADNLEIGYLNRHHPYQQSPKMRIYVDLFNTGFSKGFVLARIFQKAIALEERN